MGDSLVPTRSNMERRISPMACTILNELRLEGKFCDVTLSVDGTEFNVHRIILCSCSHYFRALFSTHRNNAEGSVYHVPGISQEMMRLIIEFAYNRTVPITTDTVESLLIAADQLNIMGIVRLCSKFLAAQLCPENCVNIWRLTCYYYTPELRQAAYKFILRHFEETSKVSTEFLDLSLSDLLQIIESDNLIVKGEDAVCEAILRWIAHNPQDRRQHIAVLLGKVRLALLEPEYFIKYLLKHEYVKDNEECKDLGIRTLTEMYNLNVHGQTYPGFTTMLSCPRLPGALLFAVGGWSVGSPTNAIEVYDSRADSWLNVTCEQESPLAYHGTAYLKGFIYVIGGFDSVDYFNSVKRFDLLRRTWQEVAPMHSQRCYISVAVLHGFIYAMGGYDGQTRLNTAERYQPETNQWTRIASMHDQRSDASATTLHEKVYICGGFNGSECLITAEVYNATTDQWSFIAPMTTSRSGVGVIAYGNAVYVVGGFDGINRLRTAEVYNPANNAWRSIATMFSPRSNFGIEVMDDCLFAVGGFNGFSTTSNVECYNEKTNEWRDIQDMSINRSALSCCVVPDLPNIREYLAR
ncbi:kelch-like protein 10 [Phaethornis superciliosus]